MRTGVCEGKVNDTRRERITLAKLIVTSETTVVWALEITGRAYFGRRTLGSVFAAYAIVRTLIGEARVGAFDAKRNETVRTCVCFHTLIFIRALNHGKCRT